MKATGVVRRIDDLGRIVIPKEIRRSLKINDGDSLEIFVDTNEVILKKYSLLDDMVDLSKKLVNTVKKVYNKNILVTDKDKVIAVTKELSKDYLDKSLTSTIQDKINNRNNYICKDFTNIILNVDINSNYYLEPIIVNSDILGSVIMLDSNKEDDIKLTNLIVSILTKSIEE